MATITRNSLLITQKGFIEAYRVKVGDYVLCADGRFREVKKTAKSKGKVWEIKGHGHPKLLVPEGQYIWSTFYKRAEDKRDFQPFKFVDALEMKGKFWASPVLYPAIKSILTNEEAWLAGLSMASGKIDKDQPILINVHESQRLDLEDRLNKMKIKFFQTSFHTTFTYQVNAPALCKWMIKNMMQTQGRRMVPLEVLCGYKDLQKGFYEGYLYGKATIEEEKYRMSADNKVEAVSIKLLSQALSLSTALYLVESKPDGKVKEYWTIVAEKSARSSEKIGRNRWGLVRNINLQKKEIPFVVIEVEGRQSLIVDGIILE